MTAAAMLCAACAPADDGEVTTAPTETVLFTRGSDGGYVIVTGADAALRERDAAEMLADAFELRLGARPAVIDDTASPAEREILVGVTNRGSGGLWDVSLHRSDDWYIGIKDGKIYILGGSDAAVYSAAEAFALKKLANAADTLTLSSDDPLEYTQTSCRISSITIDGAEVRRMSVGVTGGSFESEAARALAAAITENYGYAATLCGSADDSADLLLTTVTDTPEYSALLGSHAAVLTAKSGKAVLAARDAGTLASAAAALAQRLGEVDALSLTDGAAAFTYDPDDTLRVMSFNILGNTDIAKRRTAVLWVIAKNSPDIFGIQEGKSDWLIYLGAKLDGIYASVGKGSGENGGADTFDNIYYRTDRFELLEWDTVWLSDTPDVAGSKFSESKRVRIATYALLCDRQNGKKLLYINTHLDNASSAARLKQAAVLLELTKKFDCPVAVSGDFNSDMTSAVYEKITSVLSDSRTDAAVRDPHPTFNRLGSGIGTVLDYIFFSRDVELLSYRVSSALYTGGVYPSDHNAITVTFRLK